MNRILSRKVCKIGRLSISRFVVMTTGKTWFDVCIIPAVRTGYYKREKDVSILFTWLVWKVGVNINWKVEK